MKKLIPMGSIPQFREVVRNVKHMTQYQGIDENGEVIFDRSAVLPTLTIQGYEKLHGTQMSICFNVAGGFWVQSKGNIITPEKDNAGCAFTAYQNEKVWLGLVKKLSYEYKIDLNKNTITIFAEWCGGNIQKNSAASGLDKRVVIFRHFKVSPFDLNDDNPAYWLETSFSDLTNQVQNISSTENNIFNIADFQNQEFTIDFNNHEKSQKEIMDLIIKNENNSPFGKYFGKNENILEGYVFTFMFKGSLLRWKSKGDKHSKSKVKVQKTFTEEELQKLSDAKKCANEIFSHQRCNQALQELFGNNDEDIVVKRMDEYLKWCATDIIKEESDVIASYNLEPKDVMKHVQELNKRYFFGVLS